MGRFWRDNYTVAYAARGSLAMCCVAAEYGIELDGVRETSIPVRQPRRAPCRSDAISGSTAIALKPIISFNEGSRCWLLKYRYAQGFTGSCKRWRGVHRCGVAFSNGDPASDECTAPSISRL